MIKHDPIIRGGPHPSYISTLFIVVGFVSVSKSRDFAIAQGYLTDQIVQPGTDILILVETITSSYLQHWVTDGKEIYKVKGYRCSPSQYPLVPKIKTQEIQCGCMWIDYDPMPRAIECEIYDGILSAVSKWAESY